METFRFDEIDTTNFFRLPPPGSPIPNIFNFSQPPPSSTALAPPSRSQQQQKKTSHPRQIHRNRISYSCHACRRRKVKCDRQHPVCSNCTKNVEPCVYDDHAIAHKGKGERGQKAMRGVKRRRTDEEVSTTYDCEEGYSRGYIVTRGDSTAATTSPPVPLDVKARPGPRTTDRSKTLATKGLAESGFTQSQPYLDVLREPTRPIKYGSTEINHSASASPSPTHTLSPNIPTTPGSSIGSRSQDTRTTNPILPNAAMKLMAERIEMAKQSEEDDIEDLGIGHLSIQDGGRARYVGTGFWGLLSNEVNELNEVLEAHTHWRVGNHTQHKAHSKQAHVLPVTPGSSSNSPPVAPHLQPKPKSKSYQSEYPQAALSMYSKASFQFDPREVEGHIYEIFPTILKELPSKTDSDHLYKSYLHGVHPVMPLLHAPTFDEDYKRFWQWYPDNQHELPDSKLAENPTFIPLLMAVLYAGAVSISSKTIKKLTAGKWTKESLSSCLYGTAMSTLAACAFPRSPTLYSLISFLITQTCQIREEEPLTSCSFVGMAMRVAQSMGLHRDGSLFGLPEIECEVRRRVWWHIMYLDIQSAIATGLPPFGGSCADLYDTKMVSELKDEYIGLPQGAAAPVTPTIPHDAQRREFSTDKIDIRSSTSMILAVGRYESTILLRSIITRLFTMRVGKMSVLLEMAKMICEVKIELGKKISRIPVPEIPEMGFTLPSDPGEEGGIGVESSEVERATVFNIWARTMLSMFSDRAHGLICYPFMKSSRKNAWRYGRNCALHFCHIFLRRFLYLSQAQLFQPYQWFCPGTYQPLHAVMITLLDLHERPTSEDAQKSRDLVDQVFAIFDECGSYSTDHPLLEGGKETWRMLLRLREKAYGKAGVRIPTKQEEGGGGRKEPEKTELGGELFPPNPVQYAMQPPPAPLAPPLFPDIVMQPPTPTPTPTPVASSDSIGGSLEELLKIAGEIDEEGKAFISGEMVQEFMRGEQVFGSKMGFGIPGEVERGTAQVQEDNQFGPMAGGQELMDFDWDEWDQMFGKYISVDMGDF